MHRNSRPSPWKRGLQHRTDMVFAGVDLHEEVPSTGDATVDSTHPLSVNSEKGGKVAVRNDVDQRLAIFRRACRMLRSVGLHFELNVLRSAAYFRFRYRPLILGERTARQEKDRSDGLHKSLQSLSGFANFPGTMPAGQFLGCEVLNFDQATNHLPSSESNWSS